MINYVNTVQVFLGHLFFKLDLTLCNKNFLINKIIFLTSSIPEQGSGTSMQDALVYKMHHGHFLELCIGGVIKSA